MSDQPPFKLTAQIESEGQYLLRIAPTRSVWEHPYLGLPVEDMPRLRPQVTVASGVTPTDGSGFSSDHFVDDGVALFRLTSSVATGSAVFVRCAGMPENFCFGSWGGERFTTGDIPETTSEQEQVLQVWLSREMAATLAVPQKLELSIHPEAAAAFDRRAADLFGKLSTQRAAGRPRVGRMPDIHVSRTVQVKGEMWEEIRSLDEQGSLSVTDHQGTLALHGSDYVDFRRLSDAIQAAPALRDCVSEEWLQKHLMRWLIAVHRGQGTPENYCRTVIQDVIPQIKRREVWIPLHGVFGESEFPLGRVVFRTISRAMLDRLEQQLRAAAQSVEAADAVNAHMNRLRTRHQAHLAAVITTVAESGQALYIAKQWAEKSAAVLRLWDRAMFSLDAPSACLAFGSRFQPTNVALTVEDERIGEAAGFVDEPSFFVIKRHDLLDFMKLGLPEWHRVLASRKRSEFEDRAMKSLLLYSTGATKREVADRLLYTFAGLESVLIKDSSEPLAQNIADRLANVVETTAEARLEAVDLVKRTYSHRSEFVHHGAKPDDAILIERFLALVWKFYVLRLPRALDVFSATRAFVDSLDRMKYSA